METLPISANGVSVAAAQTASTLARKQGSTFVSMKRRNVLPSARNAKIMGACAALTIATDVSIINVLTAGSCQSAWTAMARVEGTVWNARVIGIVRFAISGVAETVSLAMVGTCTFVKSANAHFAMHAKRQTSVICAMVKFVCSVFLIAIWVLRDCGTTIDSLSHMERTRLWTLRGAVLRSRRGSLSCRTVIRFYLAGCSRS